MPRRPRRAPRRASTCRRAARRARARLRVSAAALRRQSTRALPKRFRSKRSKALPSPARLPAPGAVRHGELDEPAASAEAAGPSKGSGADGEAPAGQEGWLWSWLAGTSDPRTAASSTQLEPDNANKLHSSIKRLMPALQMAHRGRSHKEGALSHKDRPPRTLRKPQAGAKHAAKAASTDIARPVSRV